MDDVAVVVAQYLELDVVGFFHELFQIDRVVSKGGHGLGACRVVGFHHFALVMDKAHTFTTATHRRLQHHGVAYLVADAHGFFGTLQGLFRSGNHGYACRNHSLAGSYLVAHRLHRLGGGTDKDNPFLLATACKLRVLRQKAVTRMDGIGTASLCRGNHFFNIQITLFCHGRSYRISLIGICHMMRGAVGLGEDRNRKQSHLPARTHDAQGNLTSVGNQYFLNHFTFSLIYKGYI